VTNSGRKGNAAAATATTVGTVGYLSDDGQDFLNMTAIAPSKKKF
jgi:hypothetical protein